MADIQINNVDVNEDNPNTNALDLPGVDGLAPVQMFKPTMATLQSLSTAIMVTTSLS